jgi:hypothetical protein
MAESSNHFQICSRNSIHKLVFRPPFTICRQLMKLVRKLLYRITIIHVNLLLALEAGITGAIVHTAHVFVLVICPCFAFVL